MTFRENLNRLCSERGTKLTPMLTELGYSSSKATAINKGSIPKEGTLLEMAKYLQCSVMDFFADDDEIVPIKPMNEDEKDILKVFRSLSRKSKHEFMAMVYEYENREELEGDREKNETA